MLLRYINVFRIVFSSRVPDPDPHHFVKLDPDPHQSEKQDPDPLQSDKVEALEVYFGALEGSNLGKSKW